MEKKTWNANEVLDALSSNLTKAEIIAARLIAKISVSITRKRIELGMNQKQFAEYMKVTQGMISKWENGNCNFTIEKLAEICEQLDLELDIKIQDVKKQYLDTFQDIENTNEIKCVKYKNFGEKLWGDIA